MPLPFSNAGKGPRGAADGRWRSSNEAAELAEFEGLYATPLCTFEGATLSWLSAVCVGTSRFLSYRHAGTLACKRATHAAEHMQQSARERTLRQKRSAATAEARRAGKANRGGKTFAATSQGTGRAGARGRRIEGCEQKE